MVENSLSLFCQLHGVVIYVHPVLAIDTPLMFVYYLRANIVLNSLELMVLLPVEHGTREQEFPHLAGLSCIRSLLYSSVHWILNRIALRGLTEMYYV